MDSKLKAVRAGHKSAVKRLLRKTEDDSNLDNEESAELLETLIQKQKIISALDEDIMNSLKEEDIEEEILNADEYKFFLNTKIRHLRKTFANKLCTDNDIPPHDHALPSHTFENINQHSSVPCWQSKDKGEITQLILPDCWHEEVMKMLHDDPPAAHFCQHRTLARVSRRVNWADYKDYVIQWCRQCKTCEAHSDKHLQLALMAYRSSEHESTGFSPSMLMFGREIVLPVDLIYGSYPDSVETGGKSENDYLKDLRKGLWDIHDVAREKMKDASDRQKRQYDTKVHSRQYRVGDAVWIFNPLRVIAVSEIENSLDSTPMSVRELDESVVQDHQSKQVKLTPENMQEPDDLELEDEPVVVDDQSVQVSETSKDIQDPDDNVVGEQQEEDTVTEVMEELVEVTEDGMKVIKEDIRLVGID
ncbi:unnamed protein product [Mytilus edulis]|uniref:Integrase zinc-binding domain-containing protein n=1 Tax=Mytilus edulis TaxID=6550 RepID=A0A8S3SBA6_MYTED|nr:unnamed protein product [Mytilus edulis]